MKEKTAITLLVTLFLCPPLYGQKGQQPNRRADAGAESRQTELFQRALRDLGPEGETLDVVSVPPGWGDGRITERDALALARYCVWGFNRLLEIQRVDGVGSQLGDDAHGRMVEFWVYVWDHVDEETKQIVSIADHLWPQISMAYEVGNRSQKESMVLQFAEFVDEIWGEELAVVTVQYLAGAVSPVSYAQIVDQAIQEMYALASPSAGDATGVGSGSFDAMVSYTPAEESYVMNDGSGAIVYPEN